MKSTLDKIYLNPLVCETSSCQCISRIQSIYGMSFFCNGYSKVPIHLLSGKILQKNVTEHNLKNHSKTSLKTTFLISLFFFSSVLLNEERMRASTGGCKQKYFIEGNVCVSSTCRTRLSGRRLHDLQLQRDPKADWTIALQSKR